MNCRKCNKKLEEEPTTPSKNIPEPETNENEKLSLRFGADFNTKIERQIKIRTLIENTCLDFHKLELKNEELFSRATRIQSPDLFFHYSTDEIDSQLRSTPQIGPELNEAGHNIPTSTNNARTNSMENDISEKEKIFESQSPWQLCNKCSEQFLRELDQELERVEKTNKAFEKFLVNELPPSSFLSETESEIEKLKEEKQRLLDELSMKKLEQKKIEEELHEVEVEDERIKELKKKYIYYVLKEGLSFFLANCFLLMQKTLEQL